MKNRIVKSSPEFDDDLKREKKGKDSSAIEKKLWPTVDALAAGQRLSLGSRDHALKHEWAGCCDCHIKPNLLLIYQKIGDDVLYLVRLGSHARLFKSHKT